MDASREHRTDDRRTPPSSPPSLDRAAVAPIDYAESAPTIDRIWRRHQRTNELRVVAIVLAIAAVVAIVIFNPLRDPQRVLDVYAPGVRLDAPLPNDLWTRLSLRPTSATPAPLAKEFVPLEKPLLLGDVHGTTDGVRAVAIAIGPVARGPRAVTPTSPVPISRVVFSIPNAGAARRVEARIVDRLGGRFERRCFDQEISTLFWPGNRHGGALLVVPTSSEPARWRTPFAARLVLGAQRWETRLPREAKCRRD